MNVLAQQFGPTLLIATLVAPLIVLAVFFVPALRTLARAITPIAAAPALAAGALGEGNAFHFGCGSEVRVAFQDARGLGVMRCGPACGFDHHRAEAADRIGVALRPGDRAEPGPDQKLFRDRVVRWREHAATAVAQRKATRVGD